VVGTTLCEVVMDAAQRLLGEVLATILGDELIEPLMLELFLLVLALRAEPNQQRDEHDGGNEEYEQAHVRGYLIEVR
jgi:hypothetical protein